jgi:uncharacterized protein with PQ loop repeat
MVSPPVCKTYRNKSGEGLSFRMLLMLGIGVALWLVYGIMGKSLPLKRETAWRHSQIWSVGVSRHYSWKMISW